MPSIPFVRSIALLALAGGLVFSSAALAQQAATPAKPRPAAKPKPQPAAAAASTQPALLGQYGDWGAYVATNGGEKVCYALSKPTSSQTNPANRPRNPAYMFISNRPAANVKNEVSIMVGYPFKTGTEASVDIGTMKFALYTKADGAWVKNAAEETRMVEIMRKGADLTVTGQSGRGTQSTDRYSLKGLSQALDRTAQDCR